MPSPDEVRDARQRDELHGEVFARVGDELSDGAAPPREICRASIRQNRGIRLHDAEAFPAPRHVARLLAQLAAGGDEMHLICARAFLLGGQLKYEKAEAELKRAAKLHADAPELHLQAGILDCRRARWRDAVEPLQKAAAHRTDDALAHFYLGEALNHVDQLPAALQAYERATQLDPQNSNIWYNLGKAQVLGNHPTDAEISLKKAIALNAQDPSPHYQLARALEKLGRKDEARSERERFAELKKAQPATAGMADTMPAIR